MTQRIDLEAIKQSLEFPQLLKALQDAWDEEQVNRQAFWKNIDENKKAEFINGVGLYDSPVYGKHWMASTRICRYLIPYVFDRNLGEVGVEKVMIRCTRNDYEPDICFWRKEVADTFLPGQSAFPPPTFIIEILSKSTESRERGIKFQDYAAHGVEEYWLVDTDNEQIEQYVLEQGTFRLSLIAASGEVTSLAINGFSVKVLDLFR